MFSLAYYRALAARIGGRLWLAVRVAGTRLTTAERRAWQGHVDGLRERVHAAGQAGDPATLVRDQMALAPASRDRLRANVAGLTRILAKLLHDVRAVGRDLRRGLKP